MLMEMGLWTLDSESTEPRFCCQKCKDESEASMGAITAFHRGEGRARALEIARHEVTDYNDDHTSISTRAARRKRCCAREIVSELEGLTNVRNRAGLWFRKHGHECNFLP